MNPENQLRRILTSVVPALALALFLTPVSAEEFIVNGSFEDGKVFEEDGNDYTATNPGTADLPGWTGPAGFAWYARNPGAGIGGSAEDGDRYMNLVYQTGIYTLSQSFTVAAGTEYTVSYWERGRGNAGVMSTTLSLDAGTATGAGAFVTSITGSGTASINQLTDYTLDDAGWVNYGFTFTPDTTTTATLTFGNEYIDGVLPGDNDGTFLDNVSVTGAGGGATFPLTITPAVSPATGYDLKWASQAGMLYDVLSTGDLSEDLGLWDVVEAGIEATPDENTWPVTPVAATLFYRVKEYPVPPVTVFSEDFESASTLPLLGWDTGAYPADTGSTTWDLGTPSIVGPVPPGVPLPSASNCVGTNLAAIYGISSDIWLRTPAIDLTGTTGAKVVFQQWVDIDPYLLGLIGDMGTVRILDADDLPGTVTELALIAPDMALNPAGWVGFSADIPDGLGNIVVEFRFESDNDNSFDASGWYIDDVKVTVDP